ncbi:MAG: helix-turn-helix transcriptional regulator [Planctomycetes bacterium]|nr:helix-turn-helix transcriptional regulator [Planctomycetota bacterium]
MTIDVPVAYSIDPRTDYRFYAAGIRKPKRAGFTHAKRCRHEWVCYLPIRGSLDVIDFFSEHTCEQHIPIGHVHIIPPGIWQSFAKPMDANAAFLWWHFTEKNTEKDANTWQACDQSTAFDIIDQQLVKNNQERWLLPRQCNLNHCLGEVSQLHQELCNIQERWGVEDHGVTSVLKHLMHRVHQEFSHSMLDTGNKIVSSNALAEERHMRHAQWFIRKNYQKIDSLSEVAEALQLNGEYLARCSKRLLGKSIGQLILEQRIRNAQDLMRSGQYSLKEISAQCGFSSLNYFSRRFKQETGITASEWRQCI